MKKNIKKLILIVILLLLIIFIIVSYNFYKNYITKKLWWTYPIYTIISDTNFLKWYFMEYVPDKNYKKYFSKFNTHKINLSMVLNDFTWKDFSSKNTLNWIYNLFYLDYIWENCFYFSVSINKFTTIEKYALEKFWKYKTNFSECNSLDDDCYVVFTEKWILASDSIYSCK